MLLARGKKYLGILTNNQAEYNALILGLKAISAKKPAKVQVFLDSELLVHQMNGRYQVKHADLKPLYEEAKRYASQIPHISFAHVPRSQNHIADALANEALDTRAR